MRTEQNSAVVLLCFYRELLVRGCTYFSPVSQIISFSLKLTLSSSALIVIIIQIIFIFMTSCHIHDKEDKTYKDKMRTFDINKFAGLSKLYRGQ